MTEPLDVVVLARVWAPVPRLRACLEALRAQGDAIGQVVVVAAGRLHRTQAAGRHWRRRAGDTFPDLCFAGLYGDMATARNAGAAATSGSRLAFISADVQVQPGWAGAISAGMDAGVDIVSGGRATPWPALPREAELGDPLGRNGFLPWGSALNLAISREVFDQLGGFSTGLPLLEDADLCFRAQLAGRAFAYAPGAGVLTAPPRPHSHLDQVRLARSAVLLAWRYRINPYFAVLPNGRDRWPSVAGYLAAWLQLLSGNRTLPDLAVPFEWARYVSMPLPSGPSAILSVPAGYDIARLVEVLRDQYDLAGCAPGPDAYALERWDERPRWALRNTRVARRAGWGFDARLAARRLEQERARTAGDAFLAMAAVLAWSQGLHGFVLIAQAPTSAQLSERLPQVPLIDLGAGDSIAVGLARELTMPERDASVAKTPALALAAPPHRATAGPELIQATRERDPLLLASGCPRSGTTMFRNMMAAHSQIAAPLDEGNFVIRAYGQMRMVGHEGDLNSVWERIKRDPHFRDWHLDTDAIDAVIAEDPPGSYADLIRLLFAAVGAAEQKPYTMDKCTSYSMHWQWLAEQFPTTNFVHIVRDPREVCLSLPLQYFHHGSIAGASAWWVIHVMGARRAAETLGDRFIEIRYEDLVADPEGQLRAVCVHAGIEFDEAMLGYFRDRAAKPGGVHRHTDSGAPVDGLRDWRTELSRDDMVTVERIAGPWMTRYGYEPVTRGLTAGAGLDSLRFLLMEARNQWILSGAPRPSALRRLRSLTWRSEL